MAFDDFLSSIGSLFSDSPQNGGITGTQGGAPATTFAPTEKSGGGIMDILMPALIGGGSMLASKLIGRGNEKDITKMSKNLKNNANLSSNAGQAMINAASQGQLTPAQQAAVDQMKREQNTRNAQYLAGLGIPVSTAQVEMTNKTDQDALAFAQKLIDQSMQEGISLTGLGNAASTQLLTNALQQKRDLANTIGEVAKQMGQVLNQPQQKTEQPNVATSIAQAAQNYGTEGYDPFANNATTNASDVQGMGY